MVQAHIRGTVDTNSSSGLVIWITGFSGAGKTTVSNQLRHEFLNAEIHAIMLDGDELRNVLLPAIDSVGGYEIARRLSFAMTYSRLANFLAKQGFVCIVSTISLFREIHEWNRANIPNYFEVLLDVPLSERRKRDPKGIYERFDLGLEKNVLGLDLEAEMPESPNLTIEFSAALSPIDQARMIFDKLFAEGRIK